MSKSTPTPEDLIEQRAQATLKMLDPEDRENVEAWVGNQTVRAGENALATVKEQKGCGWLVGVLVGLGCALGVTVAVGGGISDMVDKWQACPVTTCPVCPVSPTPPAWEALQVNTLTPGSERFLTIDRLRDDAVTCWRITGSTTFMCIPRTDMTPPGLPGGSQ